MYPPGNLFVVIYGRYPVSSILSNVSLRAKSLSGKVLGYTLLASAYTWPRPRFILHAKKTAFVIEHDFIMATYLADRVIVFQGKPAVSATATPYVGVNVDWLTPHSHATLGAQTSIASNGDEPILGVLGDHFPTRSD